jgi:hypothetical protein
VNSTMLTSVGDPFAKVLSDLSTTLTDFAPLVKPIDAIDTLLTDIDSLLKMVGDLITAFEGVDTLVKLLGGALDFLTPIPIVGEIADVMSGLIEAGAEALDDVLALAQSINSDVIKPVMKVLKEIVTGLGDARAVVVDLSQKVPGYINTIEILHYLSEVGTPIVNVLKGTKPADDLAAVLTTFNTVQEDVGKALFNLDPAIRAVGTGIKDLTSVFNKIMDAVGDAGKDALAAVEGAAHAMQPISDGFNRLVDAIKPLKWVLDAVSCVFNKILKPVIDAILRATGLDTLVHEAEDAIFEKLGIKPVLDLVQSNVGDGSVSKTGGNLGPKMGAGTSPLWDATQTALGQYRSGDSSATKTAILAVISAVAQTPIDPNKPNKAPPFPPSLPDLTKAPQTLNAAAGAEFYVPRMVRRIDTAALVRLQSLRPRPAAKSLFVAVPELGQDLPKVDPKEWPNSAALIADIEVLSPQLDTLSPQAVALETGLKAMDAALKLPATFEHQVGDIAALLADAVHVLGVLESFHVDFVTTIVKPFGDVAMDQNTKMGQVTAAMPQLGQAITSLDTATQEVVAAFPDATLVEDTMRRVEGWRLSLGQTIAMIRAARIKDAAKGNPNKAKIDGLAQQIEASAADLHKRLTKISAHCTQIATSVGAVQKGIGSYISVLKGITQHSTLLSDKALPAADQAVHILGIVNSIIDPLAGLFELFNAQPQGGSTRMLGGANCVDGDNPMKVFGATAAEAIRVLGESSTNAPKSFEQFAEQLGEQMLPLTDMAQFVSTATDTLSNETVKAFQSNAVDLASSLKGLSAELAETKTYSATITTRDGKRQPITVKNDIVDGVMVTEAQAILQALGLSSGSQ